MLIYAVVLDMAVSASFILTSPVIASIDYERSILFVKGGIQTSVELGTLLLCLSILLICQSMITPASLFFFRYLQICRKADLGIRHVLMIIFCSLVLSQLGAVLFCFSAWPEGDDWEQFGTYVSCFNSHPQTAFLIASLESSEEEELIKVDILVGIMIYLAVLMVFSWSLSIFSWRKLIETVGEATASTTTTNIHRQMKRVLLAQFLVPLVFVHIPFSSTCLAAIFDFASGDAAEALPFLFSWGPLVNSLMVIVCVKEFRTFVFRKRNSKIVKVHSSTR